MERELPDPTGRVELLCPHCSCYLMLPKHATEYQVIELAGFNPDNPKGCPWCGTQMDVRRLEPDA